MKLQESGENYLENILLLKKRLGRVRSVDLATEMNFSKPSISRAVHLLEDEKLLLICDDGAIDLTEKGRLIAEKIYERHLFLTEFLMSIGVSAETAAEDACRMEHVISDESFERLKQAQGPCPHAQCPRVSQAAIFESSKKILSENRPFTEPKN